MANNHQINLGIGFQVDKAGLNDLTKSLRTIQVQMQKAIDAGNITKELKEAGTAASQLEDILNSSWNSKLNQLDLNKVNQGIKQTFGNVSKLKQKLAENGPAGTQAFNQVASAILNTNLQLKQSNKLLDEMATSMANTVKWGITSAIFNNISGSIQQAYGYTKRLDSSLNDIRIVTDKSAESMEKFAIQANEAAKGLGASTIDYTDAALIYYQQGLSDEEAAARAEVTLKAANVTGQSSAEVSEQLTSVWNGYKVTAEEAELYIDKLAAVAANTASDLEELSTGMSKVASAANSMGVDIDQLNAQLATIVSVTRQAPESVGTALKTIYARMSDLKLGGADEDGLSLGDVSGTMESMGISVLDETGNLREMGDVIEEVATKWNTWTDAQKTAMAQVMAGKRQYNNLVALFENWDMYTDALETSTDAAGTLQKQQDTYMESMQAHLQKLRTEAEETYDILFDPESVNGFTDALTGALNIFNNFLKSTGGGVNTFVALGAKVSKIFSKQIGGAINKQILNMQALKKNAEAIKLKEDTITALQNSHTARGSNIVDDTILKEEAEYAKQILGIRNQLTTEEYNELTALQQQIAEDKQRIQGALHYKTIAKEILELEEGQLGSYDELRDIFEERIKKETKELQTLREKREIVDETVQIYKDMKSSKEKEQKNEEESKKIEERRKENAEELKKIIQGLSEEQKKQINAERIITALENNQELQEQDILDIQKLQRAEFIEKRNLINQLKVGVQGVEDAEQGVLEEIKLQNQAREEALRQQIKEKQQAELLSNVVNGISTLVSGFTYVTGFIKTLGDESMSTAQKIETLTIGTLMTLPGLIQGFINMKNILPTVALGIINYGRAVQGTTATMTAAELASLGLAGALKEVAASLLAALTPVAPFLIAAGLIVGAIIAVTAARTADERAMKKAIEMHQELIKSVDETKKAYDNLADTVSQYDDLVGGLQKLDQGTQEYKDTLEQANEKAMELIKSNSNLAQYAKRVNGLITFESEDGEDVIQAELNKAKENANIASAVAIQGEIDVNEKKIEAMKEDFVNKYGIGMIDNLASESFLGITEEQLNDIMEVVRENNYSLIKEDLAKIESLKTAPNGASIGKSEYDAMINAILKADTDIIALTKQEDKLVKANEILSQDIIKTQLEIKDSKFASMDEAEKDAVLEIYADETKLTKKEKDDAEGKAKNAYKGKSDKKIQEAYAEAMDWTHVKNAFGGKGIYIDKEGKQQEVDDKVARQFLINDKYNELIAGYDEKSKAAIESAVEKISSFGESIDDSSKLELLGFATKKDTTFDAKNLSLETYNELKSLSKEDMLASLSNVTAEEWSTLGYDNAEQYVDAIQSGLEASNLEKDIIENARQSIIGLSGDIGSLSQEFRDGKLTAENIEANEQFQNIKSNIEDIKTLYPELTAAAETFANTNLVGTQLWTESLYQLQDAINEIETQELRQNVKDAVNEIYEDDDDNTKVVYFDAWLESDEFDKELDDILNADYALTIELHSQAEELFDDFSYAMDDLEEQASKIGDNFIIAADDVRELGNAFPGILNEMQILSDGSVQLKKEVVQAATGAAEAEIAADNESTKKQLENKVAELRAAQKNYQAMADAAAALASAEGAIDAESSKNKQIIEEGLNKLKEESANNEMENDKIVVDNSNINANQLAINWSSAYRESAKSAKKFADAAVQAARVAEKGEGSVKLKDFGVNYKGGTGVSSEAQELKKYQDLFNKGGANNYEKLALSFQQAADLNGQKAADIENMIKELDAKSVDTTNKIKNIGKGLGSDGKGSGSGSGSDSEERNEEFKDPSEEIDRYWELNTAIENINESLDDLQKKQDKLHGKQLIESLKKENELLDKQTKAYQALAEEQEKESKEIQAVLSTYGVVFDSEGGIANYLEASNAALSRYNQAVLNYNSFSIDEAALQSAEADYENFKSQLDRYEELYYNEMVDTQNQLDDIRTQKLENNLETWEIALDLQLDLSEAERDWNDFLKDINEDFKAQYKDIGAELANIFSNASTYTIDGGTIKSDIKALQDVMAEIDKLKINEPSDMFSSMSEAQEKLKELMETMQDDASALYDLYGNAWDTFINGIDQSSDKFDDLMGQFERIDDELTYQGELIELLYGQEAYSLLDNLYKAQEKNSLTQIDSLKQQKDMWFELWQNAEEGSEEQAKYYELWTKAQDSLNDKVTEYIELLKTDYMNTVDDILKKLEKGLTGSSIEDLSDEWEKMTEKSDKYLDSIEGLYEIQTLANKINDSITTTSSLKNQQKLQALYDKEIDYLREKENLTQYDLDAAEARYQIALKEIALEEAQNSKDAMKLTRGTDGNWSYQYVADEDVIASKQQELTDAYNELYQLSQDAYTSNLEGLKDLQANYLESYREIMENEILSTEEKEEKILELQSYYLEQYGLLSEENTLYRNDLAIASSALLLDLYNQDQENFEAMTEAEKELVQGLVDQNLTNFMDLEFAVKNNYDEIGYKAQEVMTQTLDQWTSGAQQIADSWNADDGISVKDQILNAEELIWNALDDYQIKVDELAQVVEQNFGEDGITGAIRGAEAATNDLNNAMDSLVSDTIEQLYGYRSALEDIENIWYLVKDSILEATDAAKNYMGLSADNQTSSSDDSSSNSVSNSPSSGDSNPDGGTGGDGDLKVGDTVTYTGGTYYYDSYGTAPMGNRGPGKQVKVTQVKTDDRPYPIHVQSTDSAYGWLKKDQLTGYDTGGYTGDWQGDDGKLALLHQKEIILNAEDTKNILDAVQTVRDMSTLSSSIEEMIMKNISSMIMKMSNLNSNTNYTTTENTNNSTENIYHISAEFPNANDVSSIKEALLSLPNIVSQRIAENKK